MPNRIFITGDKHFPAEYKYLSFKYWPLGRELSREDYIIILGDFGICWDNSAEENWWLDWFNDKPWTTLWIDGNHQNFPLLYSYPIENWKGGQTHVLRPNVRHLCRGEIFNLNNQTFFTFGGARSVDKVYRIEGKSWWPEEIASYQEMEHGINNLERYNFNIDYILAHCAPNHIVDILYPYENQHDTMTSYLEHVCQRTKFNKFFCGHYHVDRSYDNQKFEILYQNILEIMPDNKWELIA